MFLPPVGNHALLVGEHPGTETTGEQSAKMGCLQMELQRVTSGKNSATQLARQTLSTATCLLCTLDVSLEMKTSLEHFATLMTPQVNHFGTGARVFMSLEITFVGEHFVTLVARKGHDYPFALASSQGD